MLFSANYRSYDSDKSGAEQSRTAVQASYSLAHSFTGLASLTLEAGIINYP